MVLRRSETDGARSMDGDRGAWRPRGMEAERGGDREACAKPRPWSAAVVVVEGEARLQQSSEPGAGLGPGSCNRVPRRSTAGRAGDGSAEERSYDQSWAGL